MYVCLQIQYLNAEISNYYILHFEAGCGSGLGFSPRDHGRRLAGLLLGVSSYVCRDCCLVELWVPSAEPESRGST